MSKYYVMDACALIAYLTAEEGAAMVSNILRNSKKGKAQVRMHRVNLLEVYYDIYRRYGKERALKELKVVQKFNIIVEPSIDPVLFSEIARLKVTYNVSLADCFALALAILWDAKLITSDHHEFNALIGKENVEFERIRPKPQTKK